MNVNIKDNNLNTLDVNKVKPNENVDDIVINRETVNY